MKPKVVLLANASCIHTVRWAIYLSRKYSVTILSFEKTTIDNVEIIQLFSPLSGILRYLWVLPSVIKLLISIRPNILHAHYAGGYGFTGALSAYHPFIVSVWGSDIYQAPHKSLLYRQILRFILRRADYLCSTSFAMRTEASNYTDRDFLITPFGIDTNVYKPFPQRRTSDLFTIGTVKKLDKTYGVDRLLRAFAILRDKRPKVELRLLVVGDGSERENLVELAQSLGISPYVEFIGAASQRDVPDLLNRMSVYVALSRSESFGVSVLEASACGVPVVVSDAGGLPEVVVDSETGFVIKNGDPGLAASLIQKLVDSPHLCMRMGIAGREFVLSKYQWEQTAKIMDDLYTRITK